MKAEEFLTGLAEATSGNYILINVPQLKLLMTQFSPDYEIKRKNAAQIVHAFLKYALLMPDIKDKEILDRVGKIKDLYDCRVCTEGIIQSVAAGIMHPKYIIGASSKKNLTKTQQSKMKAEMENPLETNSPAASTVKKDLEANNATIIFGGEDTLTDEEAALIFKAVAQISH